MNPLEPLAQAQTQPTTYPQTGYPQQPPDLTIRIYDAVHSGSFAVILVAIGGAIYGKRTLTSLAKSPLIANLISLIKQIETNQEKIEEISQDVDRLDTTTKDLLEQVAALQDDIQATGDISAKQHAIILRELTAIRQQIRGTNDHHKD